MVTKTTKPSVKVNHDARRATALRAMWDAAEKARKEAAKAAAAAAAAAPVLDESTPDLSHKA